MFAIILLLLVGATVYVLWFHKFTLPDGTEVKGFLAKYKAEHNADPKDNPKQVLDDLVATARQSKAVETAVQAAKDLAGKTKEKVEGTKAPAAEMTIQEAEPEAGMAVEEAPEAGMAVEEAPEAGMSVTANGSNRVPTEDNPSGLSITSHPLDFEEVLQEAQADPFEKGWNLMSGYFGWLLLGASRNDLINRDNMWTIMSNACKYFKDGLVVDYKDLIARGESTEEDLWIMPAWMVNAHLLNGIGFFGERMHQYFSGEEYERIKAWYDALAHERTERTTGPNPQITDEPNAAFWLAELFTILRGEDDAMIEYNRTEYFEVTSDFDVYLPQPKEEPQNGIGAE